MSRVACVWADLADDAAASAQYEDAHVPEVVGTLGCTARNAEQAEDNMFKEVAGISGSIMTLYDLPDGPSAEDVVALIQPEAGKLPKVARLDTRVYDEYATWFGDEWCGHSRDIQMVITVLWQPEDAVHDDFVEWFRTDFAPGMLESPELLRTRIFKLQYAQTQEGDKVEQSNVGKMYQYMTVWEFDCDELPWEILVYLGSSERWRYYVEGGHLHWQIAQFMVNRIYPESEDEDATDAGRKSVVIDSRGEEARGANNEDANDQRTP